MQIIPLIILGIMSSISLGLHLGKHGERKEPETYHFGWACLFVFIWWGLLYWSFQ